MDLRSTLVLTALITSPAFPLAQAQGTKTVETQPLGIFIRTQLGMVAMPPTWQSNVLPGSIIYVDRRQSKVGGCSTFGVTCILKNKYIIPTPNDVPKDRVNQPGTMDLGALNSMGSSDVGISALVGKFAPSLSIGRQSHIDYPQSHFTSKGWGADIITSTKVLNNSTELQQDLTLGVVNGVDSHGKFAWKYFGVGYLVTSVVYATELQIAVDQTFSLSASLQALKDGDCQADKLVSLRKGDDSSGDPSNATPNNGNVGASATDTKKLDAKQANQVKSEVDSGKSTDTGTKTEVLGDAKEPSVTVKLCNARKGIYSLHISPGVPIAFSAVPVVYNVQTNKPIVQVGDLSILHKALERPDNQ